MPQDPIIVNLSNDPQLKSAKTVTTIIYALQAASFFSGGVTLLAAVVINYVKKDDVRGTWLESHFRWQIKTFWFSLLWSVLGYLTFVAVIGYFILVANMVWLIYRIAKGWLDLSNDKEMYRQF